MSDNEFYLQYQECRQLMHQRMAESAPGRIQMLTGPRQVGKTTLFTALAEGEGDRAIYVACDGPESSAPGFWERLWSRAQEVAKDRGKSYVLLDEVQMFPDWSARLKGEWDRIRRKKLPIMVLTTGSSALRLSFGSRESLAGRFERMTLTHWTAGSLAKTFSISTEQACQILVQRGSYPGAFELLGDPLRWSAYVRDAILEPAIGRDILALSPVRRPALLRQVFGIASSSPARIVSLQKIQGQLQDAGALETIAQYLSLLENAFLVASLYKYSKRPIRRRASPPKLVTLNNAFLAVSDPRGIPSPEQDPARFGSWVENACLAHAWNVGQKLSYWREEPWEVDAVLEGSWGKWAIEVKTGELANHDLAGLLEFTRRHPEFKPLLVCGSSKNLIAERAGISVMSWKEFLLRS